MLEGATRYPSIVKKSAISIIGAGRVGRALADLSPGVFSAPVILIAVPDSSVATVVTRLASYGKADLRNKVVLHTSGALSSEVLARLQPLGAVVGSIHPLQTFSGIGIPTLEGRIFAIEGDPIAVRMARAI